MGKTATAQLKETKVNLRTCKRKLKEAEEMNERLRAFVGYEELEGWTPRKDVVRMYGWVYAWLYPLRSYMSDHSREPLSETRGEINNIVTAIIAQLAIHGKYGIKLPNDPRPVDLDAFFEKQARSFSKVYEPCAICNEDRITHESHIIPRAEGGPQHSDNMVMLCPLHHHLFDHSRLSADEWEALTAQLDGKMDAAIQYADEVRRPQLESFWAEN